MSATSDLLLNYSTQSWREEDAKVVSARFIKEQKLCNRLRSHRIPNLGQALLKRAEWYYDPHLHVHSSFGDEHFDQAPHSIMSSSKPIPKFSELPVDKNGPHHNAWGLYGKDDELGTLNRLTDDVVKAAASEIQTGARVSINWPLDAQGDLPFFGRQAFHKEIYPKLPRIVNDDVWTFNSKNIS